MKPTITEPMKNEICAILAVGGTRKMAAQYIGCSVRTICRMARRDPHFAERTQVITLQISDPAEASFLAGLEVDPKKATPMTVFTIRRDGSDWRRHTFDNGLNWHPFPAPDGRHYAWVGPRQPRDRTRVEQIKRFVILPRDFSQEEGEVTPTLKLRRRVIHEHFADEIERLYAGETG